MAKNPNGTSKTNGSTTPRTTVSKPSKFGNTTTVDYGTPPEKLSPSGAFYSLFLSPEQMMLRDAIWNPDVKIVFCNAPAGTGKSVVSIGTSITMYHYGMFDGITYVVAPYAESSMGFLPGTVEQKISAYLEPLKQAVLEANESPMHCIIQECPEEQRDGAFIDAICHSYLRGQTFHKRIVIIDEAQNQTEADLRKTLSRAKDNCKVIVIGHSRQIDIRNAANSGFVRCIKHFESKADERVVVCELEHNYRGFVSRVADEAWD